MATLTILDCEAVASALNVNIAYAHGLLSRGEIANAHRLSNGIMGRTLWIDGEPWCTQEQLDAYRTERDAKRRAALDDLTRQTQDAGGYDLAFHSALDFSRQFNERLDAACAVVVLRGVPESRRRVAHFQGDSMRRQIQLRTPNTDDWAPAYEIRVVMPDITSRLRLDRDDLAARIEEQWFVRPDDIPGGW